MRISTRKIVLTAVLAAISFVLSVTPLGLIPVPNISGGATTMHLPIIVGGILGGPLSGSILGLVLAFATLPLFIGLGVNLAACFVPRLFIGVVAYGVWSKLGKNGL
ncbi:MAG TPA: ECF transporter S component, partial [Atribacteraceae bacterium]|nr:ECF transporter S component [Atribacteraceae bacterium]